MKGHANMKKTSKKKIVVKGKNKINPSFWPCVPAYS